MKRWKNFLWISIGLLVLIALAGSIVPPALAQIRAALVRDLDTPIRGERFLYRFNGDFGTNAFGDTIILTPSVPAGKKLFMQSVGIHLLLTDGQAPMETSFRILSGELYRYWLDMDFQAAGSTQRHYTGKLDLNTMLLPTDTLTVFIFRNDNLGSSSLNFYTGTLTGYLVDQNP